MDITATTSCRPPCPIVRPTGWVSGAVINRPQFLPNRFGGNCIASSVAPAARGWQFLAGGPDRCWPVLLQGLFSVTASPEEKRTCRLWALRNIYSANISQPTKPSSLTGRGAISSNGVRNGVRRIDVSGSELRFAAAHFVTFAGRCEPLHGHNYALAAQVEGDLSRDSWLFDFVEMRRLVAGLCGELDHAFLLPTENRRLEVERAEGHYQVAFGDRRYVIPEADVRPLPIDNSTAERLAEWLAGRLAGELRSRGAANLSSLTVTVEEAPGQSASFTLSLAPGPPGKKEGGRRKRD